MTENDQLQCRILAFLLDYPDTSWRAELSEWADAAAEVTDETSRQELRKFITYAEDTPALALQETYTAAFDLDPSTSLHLTYHLQGDNEERGKALAKLLWMYHQEGFDAQIGELPDYLPMILEFIALCPEPRDGDPLRSCLAAVAIIAERLAKIHHPYAILLELTAGILENRMAISFHMVRKEV